MKTKNSLFTLPNTLSAFRILLSPLFFWLLLADFGISKFIAVGVFAIGAVTDYYDGYIAEKNSTVTSVGKLLDPIADKILTFSALIYFLIANHIFPVIIIGLILRDIIITIYRFIKMSNGIIIPASKLAKFKTTLEMIAIALVIIRTGLIEVLPNSNGLYSVLSSPIGDFFLTDFLLGFTLILSVISGLRYLVQSTKFTELKQE